MVKRSIFTHAVWHPDVWGLTTLLVQSVFEQTFMLCEGSVLDLIGSSKPWKDHGAHGSRLDV